MFQILIQMLHSIIFPNFSLFYKTNYAYYFRCLSGLFRQNIWLQHYFNVSLQA